MVTIIYILILIGILFNFIFTPKFIILRKLIAEEGCMPKDRIPLTNIHYIINIVVFIIYSPMLIIGTIINYKKLKNSIIAGYIKGIIKAYE